MDRNRFIQLITKDSEVDFSDGENIEEEANKYPFAQSFQALNLKWKLLYSTEKPTKEIERASILSTHREMLKEMMDEINKDKNLKTSYRIHSMVENNAEIENLNIAEKNSIPEKIYEVTQDKEIQPLEEIEKEAVKELSNKENTDIIEVDLRNERGDEIVEDIAFGKQEKSLSYIEKLGLSYLFSDDFNEIENKKEFEEQEIKEKDLGDEKSDNSIENGSFITEKLTFNQWITQSKKIDRNKDNKEEYIYKQEKQKDVIAKFIENKPKIIPVKKEENVSKEIEFKKEEIQDIANLMTITLAQLYIEQGKYDTAITAFKILSLKYPEKSSYFATEIKKIKKIKNLK